MNFTDFEYDGIRLSDIGCIVCNFDSDSVSSNGDLSFNMVATHNGERFELISSVYEDSLELQFQICKEYSQGINMYFSHEETEYICSWLKRRSFHTLKINEDGSKVLCFEASSNIIRKEIGGKIAGFEVIMKTNAPHAFYEDITLNYSLTSNQEVQFDSASDEEGDIYPRMTIKVLSNGDLTIHNNYNDSNMVIKNCKAGEIITTNYPLIETNMNSHRIQNDFNFNFYPICNAFNNHTNTISSTLDCEITITYSPIAKIGY